MKISVVIIAHNEEVYIERCIASVLDQTRKADEIILVAHNCTDRTIEIAKKYPIAIVTCFEDGGPIISRARGIENATGDIICCTDGDCWVDKEWIENITKPFIKNDTVSIVAGYTKIENNLFWKFSCWWQFIIARKIFNLKAHRFAWGSNFAVRKSAYEKSGGLLPFISIHKELNLNYPAEDLYISLALQKIGHIYFAIDAYVFTYMPPEKTSIESQRVIVKKQKEDNRKLFTFFKI